MQLADPRTALNELQAAIEGLRLPASFDQDMPLAFEKVKIFDLQDLRKAMEELFLYANRIALIGLDGIDHDAAVNGRTLVIERNLDVTIIVADRRYSDRQKALMGDSTTPGALFLQTLLVDALAGELNSGGVVMPGAGRLVSIEGRENETGRIAFAQDLAIATDWDKASLSRGAKVAPTG